jgi:hypothetical protein
MNRQMKRPTDTLRSRYTNRQVHTRKFTERQMGRETEGIAGTIFVLREIVKRMINRQTSRYTDRQAHIQIY